MLGEGGQMIMSMFNQNSRFKPTSQAPSSAQPTSAPLDIDAELIEDTPVNKKKKLRKT